MKAFLTLQSVDQILRHINSFTPLGEERVLLDDAAGRCLAHGWCAPADLPGFDRSTVDGFAVQARDVFGAQEGSPALLECVGDCRMGEAPDIRLGEGQCARILTGGMLPEGADCVVMVEYSRDAGGSLVELIRTQAPGDNVLLHDDDAAQGAELIPAGKLLRPQEIGLMAALGCTEVMVRRRPRVAVLSTGDEVIPIDQTPRTGQVRDVNAHSLAALCATAGAETRLAGLIPDDADRLRDAVRRGLDSADVLVVSGGSSAGMRDHTVDVFTHTAGSELLAHGAAISPGKPFILAKAHGKCLMGLPGHVSSALICARVFLLPLLRRLQGQPEPVVPAVPAILSRAVAGAQGRRDYIRVRLEPAPAAEAAPSADARAALYTPRFTAVPLMGASGLLSGMVGADALIICPENREGLYAGEVVTAELL